MDFTISPRVDEYRARIAAFVDAHIVPLESELHSGGLVADGQRYARDGHCTAREDRGDRQALHHALATRSAGYFRSAEGTEGTAAYREKRTNASTTCSASCPAARAFHSASGVTR